MLKVHDILDKRYKIVSKIGQGGMGRVYSALSLSTGLRWAVKEIDLSVNTPVNLLAEQEILKKLDHPRLPKIIDIIFQNGSLYIVESFFSGTLLQILLTDRQACQEARVIEWAKQLAEILQYLHGFTPPIIHRDLKPANIIVDEKGEIKLIDFGIAREYKAGNERDTVMLGTSGYCAPEQSVAIQTDVRSDIYSLGATLYHVLTGKGPKKLPWFPPVRELNPHLSEGIEYILTRCLDLNPDNRYQSAEQLLTDLNRLHTLNSDYKKARRKKYIRYGGGVLAVLACIGAGGLFFQFREIEKDNQYQQWISEGKRLVQKKEFTKAEELYRQAINLKEDGLAILLLAGMFLEKNDNQKALTVLNQALGQGEIQNKSQAYYLMGSAYFNLEDYSQAVRQLSQAVQTGPNGELGSTYYDAYRDLAVSYGRMGEYQKAEEILNQLSGTEQFAPEIFYIKGELYRLQREYGKAIQELNRAIQADSSNILFKLALAKTTIALNNQGISNENKLANYRKAILYLNEGEQIDDRNIQLLNDLGKAYYDLGGLYESMGRSEAVATYQEGMNRFKKLADMGATNLNHVVNMAILSDKLGNQGEAEQYFAKALEMDANSSRANFNFGMYLLKHKRYTDAATYLKKTVEVNQTPGEVASAQNALQELRSKGWIQ